MKPVEFTYHRATGLDDVLERLAAGADGAKPIGGGQSLGSVLNLRLTHPRALIGITSVQAVQGIESPRESVIAGAVATHAEIENRHASDPMECAMCEVAAGIVYRAVRNHGTIGGSVVHADPAADWSSFLLCTDAGRHIRGASGKREARMQDFTRAAYTTAVSRVGIVTRVEIPRTAGRAQCDFYKLCHKTGGLAKAMGAVLVDPGRRYCRVVVDAVVLRPVVLPAATQSLVATTIPGTKVAHYYLSVNALKQSMEAREKGARYKEQGEP